MLSWDRPRTVLNCGIGSWDPLKGTAMGNPDLYTTSCKCLYCTCIYIDYSSLSPPPLSPPFFFFSLSHSLTLCVCVCLSVLLSPCISFYFHSNTACHIIFKPLQHLFSSSVFCLFVCLFFYAYAITSACFTYSLASQNKKKSKSNLCLSKYIIFGYKYSLSLWL